MRLEALFIPSCYPFIDETKINISVIIKKNIRDATCLESLLLLLQLPFQRVEWGLVEVRVVLVLMMVLWLWLFR